MRLRVVGPGIALGSARRCTTLGRKSGDGEREGSGVGTTQLRLPEGLLIGREEEIRALSTQLERAKLGRPSVACITGRSGAGKTALGTP